jgi:hypothetical protein
MNYHFLLYSVLFALASFSSHIFYKWWRRVREEKGDAFIKEDTDYMSFNLKLIKIGLGLASLVYLLKGIGWL